MPYAKSQGASIYFEETGKGTPIMFLHEFAGDYRSWSDQIRYFSRSYRCIAVAARGYPPSDVPRDDAAYSQDLANRDAVAVLDHLHIDRAHVVGLSMGAFTALQLTIRFPDRLLCVVSAGAGSGSHPSTRQQFRDEALAASHTMERLDRLAAEQMGVGPTRVQLFNKDPQGWRTFVNHLAEHPPIGSALVLRNVQGKRPSLYEQDTELSAVKVPVLLIVGDEDEPCLDTNLFMKRIMPSAQLAILPGSGHVLNYEEPAFMNHIIERFLGAVDRSSWRPRDPRAIAIAGNTFGVMLEPARSQA